MGLIKLAVIGGAAYYAVKGIRSDRESRCGRGRQNQNQYSFEDTRQTGDGKAYDSTIPPSYPTEQNQSPYAYPPYQSASPDYTHEKQQKPSSYQQMIFTEPKQAYNVKDIVPYNMMSRSNHQSENKADDLVDQAMRHLNSGNQEKAREILAGAITSNRMH